MSNSVIFCKRCGDYYNTFSFDECPGCDALDYAEAILICREKEAINQKLAKECESALIEDTIKNLLNDFNKQNITDLLLYCQMGKISCHKCADLIKESAYQHYLK